MPPFQSLNSLERMGGETRWIVEQHVADPAAQDDAERHPQHEIVEVGDRQRRRSAPVALGADQRARVEPAEQDADDIGERIPADRERPDPDQHRIEGGKVQDEERHFSGSPAFAAVMREAVRRSQGEESAAAGNARNDAMLSAADEPARLNSRRSAVRRRLLQALARALARPRSCGAASASALALAARRFSTSRCKFCAMVSVPSPRRQPAAAARA